MQYGWKVGVKEGDGSWAVKDSDGLLGEANNPGGQHVHFAHKER